MQSKLHSFIPPVRTLMDEIKTLLQYAFQTKNQKPKTKNQKPINHARFGPRVGGNGISICQSGRAW
ncbi:MAG: hypothetical protein ACI95X_001414 [Paraglaciecola sp.]|jgi:hypothetical protein